MDFHFECLGTGLVVHQNRKKGASMSYNVDERLPGLSLFLCEQASQIPLRVEDVCMGDIGKIYCSCVRYESR